LLGASRCTACPERRYCTTSWELDDCGDGDIAAGNATVGTIAVGIATWHGH